VSPTTHTVATRAAAAAPVGGGGGRGQEELPHPPRADAAARCLAPPTLLHAVADRLVIGVNARPQRRPPVRRDCDPRGAGAADVRPPPGAGVATLPLHVCGGRKGGWKRWRDYLPPYVAPVRSSWQQRWRVRPLVGSRVSPRLLLPPLATGSQAVGAGSAQGGRWSLDGRMDSAKGAPRGVAATVARPPPLDRLAPRRGRSWGEEARGGGCEPRRQSGRGSCPAPWRGAGNGSGRVCRGRVLACCRGMPCVGLIAMTLHVHYVPCETVIMFNSVIEHSPYWTNLLLRPSQGSGDSELASSAYSHRGSIEDPQKGRVDGVLKAPSEAIENPCPWMFPAWPTMQPVGQFFRQLMIGLRAGGVYTLPRTALPPRRHGCLPSVPSPRCRQRAQPPPIVTATPIDIQTGFGCRLDVSSSRFRC